MKVIIAGSRTITDPLELEKAIACSLFEITETVSGGASGVDQLAINRASALGSALKIFYADWKKHGKAAGPIRNSEMVNYVGQDGALLAVWDGVSRGTKDIISKAEKNRLKVYIHLVKREEKE